MATEQVIKMRELLYGNKTEQVVESLTPDTSSEKVPVVENTATTASIISQSTEIPVQFTAVDAIELPEISDIYGRLSDIIEALEKTTGFSVIPLEMANIAPEVKTLQRHEIFVLDGKRYAMSKLPRENAIHDYQEKIIQNLQTGLPFRENLIVPITHNGKEYSTINLSRVEWTLILSMFRNYKQSIVIENGKDIILDIFAERV